MLTVQAMVVYPPRALSRLLAIGLLCLLPLLGRSAPALPDLTTPAAPPSLPLSFMPNLGQADPDVGFTLSAGPLAVQLAPAGPRFLLGPADGQAPPAEVRLSFPGANPSPALVPFTQLPGRINLLRGADPAAWRRDIPAYGEVRYRDLYPGVDLAYRSEGGTLKSEFLVAAGVDPAAIRLRYQGAAAVALQPDGSLRIESAHGALREAPPLLYQTIDGRRRLVAGSYRLLGEGLVGFQIGPYDQSYPLVIDPIVAYGTFLGGDTTDRASGIAIDPSGNIYIGGRTLSTNFNTRSPIDGSYGGGINGDAFIAKLDPTGATLIYATYIGGSDSDIGTRVAADNAGNAYLTGNTFSSDFPTKNAYQSQKGVNADAFVVKLSPDGAQFIYATFLGGNSNDRGADIAVDSAGNAYLTGSTSSTDFPTKNAYQSGPNFPIRGSSVDAFVSKFTPAGDLSYSTYLGGSNFENIDLYTGSIAVDSQGRAVVAGLTTSDDFPTKNAVQDVFGGGTTPSIGGDMFIAKLTSAGSGLVFSTYLGGSGDDAARLLLHLALDPSGNIYVTGSTNSTDFPVANALQPAYGGGSSDAFVASYTADGTQLRYATYLGGAGLDDGSGIIVAADGTAYATGLTLGQPFPITTRLGGQCASGGFQSYLAGIQPNGAGLRFATLVGGCLGNTTTYDIALDSQGRLYLTGDTNAKDLSVRGGPQLTSRGGFDAFILRVVPETTAIFLPLLRR